MNGAFCDFLTVLEDVIALVSIQSFFPLFLLHIAAGNRHHRVFDPRIGGIIIGELSVGDYWHTSLDLAIIRVFWVQATIKIGEV